MNNIKYGAEAVEDYTHHIPTPVMRKSNSKCLYFMNNICNMRVRCKYYQKNVEDKNSCPVDGYSNVCLRLL